MRRLRRGIAVIAVAFGLTGCPPTGDPPPFMPTLDEDMGGAADGATPTPDGAAPPADAAPDQGAAPPDGGPDAAPDLGPDDDCVDHDDDGFVVAEGCPGDLRAGDCAPRDPARAPGLPEACNLLDDDCDGRVDEGGPGEGDDCDTGEQGICAAGTTACQQGELACDPIERRALRDTCNGLDDDCDGATDEEGASGERCDTGAEGVCGPGREQCVGGAPTCVADVEAGPEVCNGIDDDCDGTPDEGDPGGGGGCPTDLLGVCGVGVERCSGGAITCVATVEPSAERCNGLDDDCDGSTDEAFPDLGDACTVGTGACERASTRVCGPDSQSTVCDASAGNGAAELCNGADDDCDEVADEAFPDLGDACTAVQGVCAREGVRVCAPDAQATACDATPGPSGDEACNGLDDDCDGVTDEDFPQVGEACVNDADFACPSPGTWRCGDDGGVICDAVEVPPGVELCNGADDDCDDAIDEDFPTLGDACSVGVGACARIGAVACDAEGGASCDATPGDAAAEACNQIDDDCDGRIDNEAPCAGPPVGRVTRLRIAEFAADAQGCADIDGDGLADNALGAVAGLFNGRLDTTILGGQRVVLVRAPGFPPAAAEPLRVEILEGDAEGAPTPAALDALGRGRAAVEGVAWADGAFATPTRDGALRIPSPLFYDRDPAFAAWAFLEIRGAALDGPAVAGAQGGLALDGVRLTGWIDRATLLAAYRAAADACAAADDPPPGCEAVRAVPPDDLDANLTVDLERDADVAGDDAYSVCLLLTTEGRGTGVPIGGADCAADSDCYAGQVCRPAPVAADGDAALALRCGVPAGAAERGEPCATDADCVHGLCVTATAAGGVCSTLCDADADCPDAWSCRGVERGVEGATSPGGNSARVCVPVAGSGEPCTADTCAGDEICALWLAGQVGVPGGDVRVEGACQAPTAGAATGALCGDAYDCERGPCAPDLDGLLRCAAPCDGPDQCAAGTRCVDRPFPGGGAHALCLPLPTGGGSALPCTADADCPGSETCAGDRLQSGATVRFCAAGPGPFAAGQPCGGDDDCASGRCLRGLCSGACSDAEDCGPRLYCAAGALLDPEGAAVGAACVPASRACTRDLDCAADPACAGGRCVCRANTCTIGCRYPGVCPGGDYCQPDGLCAPFCRDDAGEPDDGPGQGRPLALDRTAPSTTISRTLCATSAVDWHSFQNGGQPFTITARVTDGDADAVLDVALTDGFGTVIATATPGAEAGTLEVGIDDPAEAGDRLGENLKVRVRGAPITHQVLYDLTIDLDFGPCPDPAVEPRDDAWAWTELLSSPGAVVDQDVDAWICPQDVDWYTVWLDGGDRLTVDFTVLGNDGLSDDDALQLDLIGPDHPDLGASRSQQFVPAPMGGGQIDFTAPITGCGPPCALDEDCAAGRTCVDGFCDPAGADDLCHEADGRPTEVVCFGQLDCQGLPYYLEVRGAGALDRSAYRLEAQVQRAFARQCIPDPWEHDDDFVLPLRLRALTPPDSFVLQGQFPVLAPDVLLDMNGRRSCGADVDGQQTLADFDNIRVFAEAGERIEVEVRQPVNPQPLLVALWRLNLPNVSNVATSQADTPISQVAFDIDETATYTVGIVRSRRQAQAVYAYHQPYGFSVRRVSTPPVEDAHCAAPTRVVLINNQATVEGTTAGSADDVRPIGCRGGDGPDRMFVVRLPAGAGELTATVTSIAGDGYDPAVSVRSACDAEGSEIACNEDDVGSTDPYRQARVVAPFDLPVGLDVYVAVDSFDAAASGAFRLELRYRAQ